MAIDETQMFECLANKYAGDDWACIPQVPDGTGSAKCRTADAIAMSLWPSRGLELHGFEIKVSRSDFLSELKSPEKAESIAQFCDRWWIVTASGDIAKADELPKNWGLMVKHGDSVRVRKQAPVNENLQPVTRTFLAGLLRASDHYRNREVRKYTHNDIATQRYQEGFREGRVNAARETKYETERLNETITSLRDSIADFEAASGFKLNEYNGPSVGEAVRRLFVHAERFSVARERELRNAAQAATSTAAAINELLELLPEFQQLEPVATPR